MSMSSSTAAGAATARPPLASFALALERPAGEIRFPQGLPGFPAATRFRLEVVAREVGLLQLVSAEEPGLRFLVLAHEDGRLPLDRRDLDAACAALGIGTGDAAVLLVVTAQGVPGAGGPRLHANLRAPIFLDTAHQAAFQHVLPCPGYPVRHPLTA